MKQTGDSSTTKNLSPKESLSCPTQNRHDAAAPRQADGGLSENEKSACKRELCRYRISKEQARRVLSSLHFEQPSFADSPEKRVLEQVRRRGCVQYDPLNVVGRNADLVLQSRIPGYRPEHLHSALYSKRMLLDGFDKNLAIYPVEDFPLFARERRENHWYHTEEIKSGYAEVLKEIRDKGPICSDDLEMGAKVNWPWGPTKLGRAALESLWMSGTLVLHHRNGARRYFDLAARHIPSEILHAPDPNRTEEDYNAWQLLRRMGSVGFLWNGPSDALLGTKMKAPERNRALERLIGERKVAEIWVEGIKKPFYIRSEDIGALERACNSQPDGRMRVLAPLDNLIWDRKLIETLYGFQYRWEVYVPAAARKYGYYVLPVYHQDEFVARFEPTHFRGGKLTIANWWWEKKTTREIRTAQRACLKDFCDYLGADDYEVQKEYPYTSR